MKVNKIQAIRGMNDQLPEQTAAWQRIEAILRELARRYGYQEIRLPILEKTELFKRCIGDVTDIVEKEMYTFTDRGEDSIALRPEGTAGCVRAGVEHGLFYNQIQRWWYVGPMFRRERPQKGRYRQFHQFGLEAFGLAHPASDAELILMSARLWQELGLQDALQLEINSLGSAETRAVYKQALITYFQAHFAQLDADSQRRLHTNPLRILDSKNPALQELIQQAPRLTDYLDEAAQQHFNTVQDYLKKAGVSFTLNPCLVRGLDYYNDTVFEWVIRSTHSAQNTVCAGGRYDKLVEQLGGQSTPAVGLAIGLERLIDLLSFPTQDVPDLYFIVLGERARAEALLLAEQIRQAYPRRSLLLDLSGASIKSQFKQADKRQARYALILGESEVESQTIALKNLQEKKEQSVIAQSALLKTIAEVFHDA